MQRWWLVDFSTLVLVLLGAAHLGLLGFFDVNLVADVFGKDTKFAYDMIGIASLWQISRQRLI
ncbi:MAG TPA: DUF378 domain-containing protein [Stellaceae bacterium]|jgi:uncharacterized membrane protein YuzA (DUF378 family)|nr:DUF378 domain-containing protein [Stellaceae bacterium]